MKKIENLEPLEPKTKKEKANKENIEGMDNIEGKTGRFKGFFTKRRKIAIIAGMFVLLVVTGYLNFSLNSKTPVDSREYLQNQNLFTMFRTTRADERAASIAVYQNMVNNSQYSTEAQNEARAKLFEIEVNRAFEVDAEGQIRILGVANGYEDVIVSRSNGNVNVLIKRSENIDRLQAVAVMEILRGIDSALDIDNVFISVVE